MPCKPWAVVGADIFSINNNRLLCIVDYYSKFPIVEKADGFSADDLIRAAEIVLAEFGLPKKIVSDAGMNFISDHFKQFCGQLSLEQAITSSFHHQSNGQVEACIKFVKNTIKKGFDNDNDINLVLLQIALMPISAGILSLATHLFNRPIRAQLSQMNMMNTMRL